MSKATNRFSPMVSICCGPDVQRLTWEVYMHKRLVRTEPAAHARILGKDLCHLIGVVPS